MQAGGAQARPPSSARCLSVYPTRAVLGVVLVDGGSVSAREEIPTDQGTRAADIVQRDVIRRLAGLPTSTLEGWTAGHDRWQRVFSSSTPYYQASVLSWFG